MNLVQRVFGWMLHKATGFPPWNTATWPAGLRPWGSSGSAEGLAVVYGCIRIRAQIIGSVPLHLYRRKKSGTRVRADDDPLYELLHESPSEYANSMEFRTNLERSFCLWGNAYAHLNRIEGQIVSIDYLPPERVQPKLERGRPLYYKFTSSSGELFEFPYEDMLHVRNFSNDGICGISPLLQPVMEHTLAAQSFSSNFLKNAGRVSGVIQQSVPRPASDAQVEKLANDWQANHGGPENAGKTPILWNGATYQPISVPPDEAQLIETARKLSGDIAGAIYGVPLNLLGIESQTSTFASAEQFARQFLTFTISPQCKLYEQALNKTLFRVIPGVPAKRGLYCEFDLDALQRGDSASQAEFYRSAIVNSWMKPNEVRAKQNLEPEEGGDDLLIQSNMTKTKDLNKQVAPESQTATETIT